MKGKVEEFFNEYSRDNLERPDMIDDVGGKLEREYKLYKLEASAQLRKAVKSKQERGIGCIPQGPC